MLTTTRSPIGRLAATTIVVLPFALAACMGGEEATKLAAAEARRGEQPKPVETPVIPVSNTVGGTGVSTVPTYASGDEAFKAGSYKDAAEMYRVHVGTAPNDANGYYMLGLASWKAGDFEGAKDAFDKAIDLKPEFAKNYFNKARVLLDMKRAPEALEVIEKGRSVDSTSPDGWRLKARAQAESGDFDGAITTYRELLVRDDADTWGLNNLGVLLLDHGQFEDALGPLARLVQVKPTAPLFQNNLGMALERSGYRVAALHHYQEAVRNDSTFTKAVKNADRLGKIVTDTTATDEVSVQELAEQFRQKVKAWKDGVTKTEVGPAEPK